MTNNVVARFVGGSPVAALLRLIVVSFVVGLLLESFGFDPVTLFDEAARTARHIIEYGLTDVRQVGRILLDGGDGGRADMARSAPARRRADAIGPQGAGRSVGRIRLARSDQLIPAEARPRRRRPGRSCGGHESDRCACRNRAARPPAISARPGPAAADGDRRFCGGDGSGWPGPATGGWPGRGRRHRRCGSRRRWRARCASPAGSCSPARSGSWAASAARRRRGCGGRRVRALARRRRSNRL